MRIANVAGRTTLIDGAGVGVDVEKASDGQFTSDPQMLFERWEALLEWAGRLDGAGDFQVDPDELGAPTPAPRQVFAIGLNYADLAAESNVNPPDTPPIFTRFFTKFQASITGPNATVTLPSNTVDCEVELVVAIGRGGSRIAESEAWSHVAGLMIGQDLSVRMPLLAGPLPQLSLGKSYPGFSPLGPALVTIDEVDDPDDLELGCALDGEVLQHARTRDMIFGVGELIARISAVNPLLPGDVIFTGTPAGVGADRTPRRYLTPDSTLTSYVGGVGELRNDLVAAPTLSSAFKPMLIGSSL